MERLVMNRFGMIYADAKKVTARARENLGLKPSCEWTKELEDECMRLCSGMKQVSSSQTSVPEKQPEDTSMSTEEYEEEEVEYVEESDEE